MIINRPAGSTWAFLGANDPGGLTTTGAVSLGYSLGDISEHGPANYGVRASATGFVFALFGGFCTFVLRSHAVGGTLIRWMRTNLLTTSIGVNYTIRPGAWTWAAPPQVAGNVETGIGVAANSFEYAVSNTSIGVPPTDMVFVPPEYTNTLEVFVPSGSSAIFQSQQLMTGHVTRDWVEFPA